MQPIRRFWNYIRGKVPAFILILLKAHAFHKLYTLVCKKIKLFSTIIILPSRSWSLNWTNKL
jgi:hypothetical protein